MAEQVKCFFAYPAIPPALAETIENAISVGLTQDQIFNRR